MRGLGFDPATLIATKGFARIKRRAVAVQAAGAADKATRRFEILARQVFIRFKGILMETSAFAYAERRDTAEVTEVLKELNGIVNKVIRTDPSEMRGDRRGVQSGKEPNDDRGNLPSVD